MQRESLSSRLGFILLSAGCAIGLGNIWRFPYITGLYGGAAFVLIYLVFLVIMGLPLIVAEFAVGRASIRSAGESFDLLEPKGTKWHLFKYIAYTGNIILMMFYTVVSGWLLNYLIKMLQGEFTNLTPEQIGATFGTMLGEPTTMIIYTITIIVAAFGICYLGIEKGVERITKPMMLGLFLLIVVLVIKACALPNAAEGLKYYLLPDFNRLMDAGISKAVFAAMGQAFFTLGLGVGSLAIFGSYIGKNNSLTGEAIWIIALDTFIALMAGLVIFPACSSFGLNQAAGPVLIFITLPNIFNSMAGGQFWGTLFFIFMVFASFSTVIAVFENIVAITCDIFHIRRRPAIHILTVAMILLALPCIFGFNIWSNFQPMGQGTCVLDLEDFILSNNILPIGTLTYIVFCTSKYGWGWDNFIKEANTGFGLKLPVWAKKYLTYMLPLIIFIILINGYISIFYK
ncbi:MAG: sodium-dependent transporter [Phascolarctobacterium sp.]|nr:sodium-dependent transporter [Candidatus Phascolarctobacterium caballi]